MGGGVEVEEQELRRERRRRHQAQHTIRQGDGNGDGAGASLSPHAECLESPSTTIHLPPWGLFQSTAPTEIALVEVFL